MKLTQLTHNVAGYVIPNSVPIIRTPAYLKNVAVRARRRMDEKSQQAQRVAGRRRELKRNPIMIECKDGKLNHYRGQLYPKFDVVPLASAGWRYLKSNGDYFVVKASGVNPAFQDELPRRGGDAEIARGAPQVTSWEDLNLIPPLVRSLESLGFLRPTKIQCDAIPALLDNQHCLISAETGSGKTLAYVLPVLQTVSFERQREESLAFREPRVNRPLAMIVTPGRELAHQVAEVVAQFSNLARIHVVTGGSFLRKMHALQPEEIDVVVGTVGMLGKFFFNNVYDTSCVKSVILDEADTLVDQSFEGRTKKLLENFFLENRSAGITTNICLVGATIPSGLEEFCQGIIPVVNLHRVVSPFVHCVMPHVEQKFIRVSKPERAERLLELLKSELHAGQPTIVFSSKSSTADWVSLFLNENGVKTVNYNATMMKNIRDDQFGLFRSGAVSVLSSTDLGSRGLDTSKVKHIVNYDFPVSISDYIHRCGRVGRVGGAEDCRMTSFVWKRHTLPIVQAIEYAVRKQLPLDEVKLETPRRSRRK